VKYTYECKQTSSINGGVNQFCQAKNSSSGSNSNGKTTTMQDSVTITKANVNFETTNSAQNLLAQASNIMNVLNTQCPLVRSTHD
ncbi:SabA family sialic acid-binding adhesin, partial [Helicobacter pylori]|uniref:SabA family sialic acid-binding adhesin n=1 Tax=Helicobacter pylori TaxID=210 RepID=UPI0027E4BC2E